MVRASETEKKKIKFAFVSRSLLWAIGVKRY